MLRSKKRALKSLAQNKVVDIADYRLFRAGQEKRKLAFVSQDQALFAGLKDQLAAIADLEIFDSRFALDQATKQKTFDGIILDERSLKDEAISVCEKLKKQAKAEDSFVVILSARADKELVRLGYEKGCDEWITKFDDVPGLGRLLSHHLS